MKKYSILFICFIVIICCGCEKLIPDRMFSIWTKNNTNQTIYSEISSRYPDTTLGDYSEISFIKSGKQLSTDSSDPWEERFSTIFQKDTLIIFFINADTLNIYGWETIKHDFKIIERREYSKDDLIKSNWVINYP